MNNYWNYPGGLLEGGFSTDRLVHCRCLSSDWFVIGDIIAGSSAFDQLKDFNSFIVVAIFLRLFILILLIWRCFFIILSVTLSS